MRSVVTHSDAVRDQRAETNQWLLRITRSREPEEVLSFLHDPNCNLDEKDRIYAALINTVQADENKGAEAALALLWLGLWPGLDAIYRRRLQDFRGEPEALVSEIAAIFTMMVHRIDLRRIHRVAATLVRNVDRDIREVLKRKWADDARYVQMPEDDDLPMLVIASSDSQCQSELGVPPGLSPDEEIRYLREVLVEIVGDDADLVIGAAIYGESQRELGERLGLTHEAARKRYQRAIARLREQLRSE